MRKSSPSSDRVRRHRVLAVEVRVPSLGTAFGALVATLGEDRVFLSTFQELATGTRVILELSLPDGPAVVDGVVALAGDPAGQGIAVDLETSDLTLRERLAAASSAPPPSAKVA